MTKREINTFIESMEEIGDIWTPEQVADVYGDWALKDAIKDRRSLMAQLGNILGTVLNT